MNPFTIIPLDKVAHFLAGLGIFLLTVLFFNPIASMALVVCVAFFKELIIDQVLGWGNPDKWDALATVLGGVLGAGGIALAGYVI